MSRRSGRALPIHTKDHGLRRQGRAARKACAALGMADARIFLSRHHQGLSARPLDLARTSAAGLTAVEAAICVESRRETESC